MPPLENEKPAASDLKNDEAANNRIDIESRGKVATIQSHSNLCTSDSTKANSFDAKTHNNNAVNDIDHNLPIVVEATWKELVKHWFILGWTAFGGPAAHIGMFQKLFVEKLHWCTQLVFTELLMLSNCLPGPSSTQTGFALGVLKKGLPGGAVAGVLFQGPGLLMLSVLGWAAASVLQRNLPWLNGIVAGLAAAGIALIASACKSLVKNICTNRLLEVIATVSAVIAYYYPKPWTFPSLILLGGLVTIVLMRKNIIKVSEASVGVDRLGFNKLGGAILLLIWIAVLVTTVVIAGKQNYNTSKELHWFAAFYRTGSVIFGGGQVVLPMLYNDVVAANCQDQQQLCCPVDVSPSSEVIQACQQWNATLNPSCQCSWMTGNEFYAGLALAQAMPGPLFNFAAYLGAVLAQNTGVFPIVGIALCWIGLFAPGILIIFAILPFWGSFRKWQIYRRCTHHLLCVLILSILIDNLYTMLH